MEPPKNLSQFEIGEKNPFNKYFTGQSYLNFLTKDQVLTGLVTFEPKCRNFWHIHHAKENGGQILICTAGRGYFQEWGKDPIEMTPGKTVNIPANVKHWHGASKDSWFQHIALEVPGTECSTEWLEPVSDEHYNKLK